MWTPRPNTIIKSNVLSVAHFYFQRMLQLFLDGLKKKVWVLLFYYLNVFVVSLKLTGELLKILLRQTSASSCLDRHGRLGKCSLVTSIIVKVGAEGVPLVRPFLKY